MIGKGKANKPTYKVNKKFEYYKFTSLFNKHLRRISEKNTPQQEKEETTAKKNNKWGSWTERINILINAILAFVTYLLFQEAIKQNEVAQISANAASTAVKQTEKSMQQAADSDSVNQVQLKKSTAIADSSMKAQIELADATKKQIDIMRYYSEKSDSNYIKAIQIANNQLLLNQQGLIMQRNNFENENRAYLYFDELLFDTLKVGKNIAGSITIKNYGKSPAFINQTIFGISFSYTPILDTTLYEINNSKRLDIILTPNDRQQFPIKWVQITKEDLDLFKQEKLFYFYHGEVYYSELITDKKFVFAFCYKMNWDGRRFSVNPKWNFIKQLN